MNDEIMGTVKVVSPEEIRHSMLNRGIRLFNEQVRTASLQEEQFVECYFSSFDVNIIEDLIGHITAAGWKVEVYRDVECPYFSVNIMN